MFAIARNSAGVIWVYQKDGTLTQTWDLHVQFPAKYVCLLMDIAVAWQCDGSAHVLVADASNDRVFVLREDGTLVRVLETWRPTALAVTAPGMVTVHHCSLVVSVFNITEGTLLHTWRLVSSAPYPRMTTVYNNHNKPIGLALWGALARVMMYDTEHTLVQSVGDGMVCTWCPVASVPGCVLCVQHGGTQLVVYRVDDGAKVVTLDLPRVADDTACSVATSPLGTVVVGFSNGMHVFQPRA